MVNKIHEKFTCWISHDAYLDLNEVFPSQIPNFALWYGKRIEASSFDDNVDLDRRQASWMLANHVPACYSAFSLSFCQ